MAGRRGAPPSFKEGKLQKRDFRSRTPEEMAEIQKKAAEARRKGDVAAIKQIDDMTNGIVPEQSQPIVINIKSAKGESSEVEAAGNGIRKSKARHDNEAMKITGSKASVKIKQEAEDEAWPDEDDEDWPDEE